MDGEQEPQAIPTEDPGIGVLLPSELDGLRRYLAQEAHYRETLNIITLARNTFLDKILRGRGFEMTDDAAYHVDEVTGIIRQAPWPKRED